MNWLKKYKLEFWFLIISLSGYPIFSAFAIPFNISNTRLFSVPFRVIVFFLSLLIILNNFKKEKFKNFSLFFLILFWIFYTVKLFISLSADYYKESFLLSSFEIYYRIIIIILFPSIALMLINYKKYDLLLIVKYIFYIHLIMLSLNFVFGLLLPHDGLRFQFIFSMYYISCGHLGATLAIISFFFLIFENEKNPPFFILFYGLFLGVLTIILATARSPILALMLVFFYLLIVKRRIKFIIYFIFFLISFLIGLYFYGKMDLDNVIFLNRTYKWIFEGDNSLRTPLYNHAIEVFGKNVLWGGRILYEDGGYPHNIFLELLMGTGVIGFTFYFLKFAPVIKNLEFVFSNQNNRVYVLFFALFLQYFILSLTSYSVFSVSEFLYYSSIIIGIINNKKIINNEI